MSLALLLGSAQTTLAKNTPIPDPSLQSGVTEGGPGAGDVEAVVDEGGGSTIPVTRTDIQRDPHAYSLVGGQSAGDGGVSDVIVFEPNTFGYYEFVFEMFKADLLVFWQSTLTPAHTDYEE